MEVLKRIAHYLLPLVLLLAGVGISQRLLVSAPKAKRRSRPAVVQTIQVAPLRRTDFLLELETRGSSRAPVRTRLPAEVAGRVVEIAADFREGGFFKAGQTLVRIDSSDLDIEVQRLTLELGQAKASLSELEVSIERTAVQVGHAEKLLDIQRRELKRAREIVEKGVDNERSLIAFLRGEVTAARDLDQLRGNLKSLKSQRVRLEGAIKLAGVRLARAQLDVKRTEISAPYDGRVLAKNVELGEFVQRGSVLGTVFGVDRVEVRLPLTNKQVRQLELGSDKGKLSVTLQMPGGKHVWQGTVVAMEAAVQQSSRQLFVIVEVDLNKEDKAPALLMGSFVLARIKARTLKNVFVLPRDQLLRSEVLVLSKDRGSIERRAVEVLWKDRKSVVFDAKLGEGALICTTPVVFAGEKLAVRVAGDNKAKGRGKAATVKKRSVQ